jgi:hypothetical protein
LAFHSGREADHSPPSNAEVKEWVELYLHSPNTPSWRGAQGEHRDNFTFTFFVTGLVRVAGMQVDVNILVPQILEMPPVSDRSASSFCPSRPNCDVWALQILWLSGKGEGEPRAPQNWNPSGKGRNPVRKCRTEGILEPQWR